jgi:excisionase family DNA binding protein
MNNQNQPRLLDIPELIHRTSLHKTKLYELIKAGQLRPIKLGRKTVFSEQEVNQWIENVIKNGGVKWKD